AVADGESLGWNDIEAASMYQAERIPYLSEKILERLGITTADVIESIEAAIGGIAAGTAWSAPKAVIMPPDGRYMMAALAAMDDPSLLVVKTVVLNPRNSARGLPQINGLVTVLDSSSGLPVAILDGNWVTAVRTAGLSAVAAKYMANRDASVAAFIGCGVQARSHLQAFAEMFPLRRIRLFGRGQANIDRLCELAGKLGLIAELHDSPRAAIDGADLLVTSVTFSPDLEPFLDADWLAPGCFAAITDLAAPWHRDSFAALDRIALDDLEQETALPNKLVDLQYVSGDLLGLISGKFAGRDSVAQRTAFVFRGLAIGDLALTALALRQFNLAV
ncbi:MAG TPA: ornithine cyclodeaminase family protein, partial [Gammaproteobacteria bacterium]